jgi:hypothetical protein
VSDYHCKQFDGTVCGQRNCAACSGAMAVAFAGGPQLTGKQFRSLSGVSCALGEDTLSGGLRSTDVYRVAQSFGVAINYGGGQGAVNEWPASALEYRLRIGQGCIVLGDAQEAPVNPSYNVVYHSAWVHDFRVSNGVEQTHWHDPRNAGPQWVSLAGVHRYWAGMDHGIRFAGFVAPNQVEPPPDIGGPGTPAPQPPLFKGLTMQNIRVVDQPTIGMTTLAEGAQLINPRDTRIHFGPYPFPLDLYVYGRHDLLGPDYQPMDIEGNQPPKNNRDQLWLVQNPRMTVEGTTLPAHGAAAFALRQNCGPLRK